MLFKKPEDVLFERPEDLFKYVSGGIAAPTKKNFKKLLVDYQHVNADTNIWSCNDSTVEPEDSDSTVNNCLTFIGPNGVEFKTDMLDRSTDEINRDINYLSALYEAERKKDLLHLGIFSLVSGILIASLIGSSKKKDETIEDGDICIECKECEEF